MNLAFVNLKVTPAVSAALSALKCNQTSVAHADILFAKISSLDDFPKLGRLLTVLFMAKPLLSNPKFQKALSDSTQGLLIFSDSDWENQVVSNLMFFVEHVRLRVLAAEQEKRIESLSLHTDELIQRFQSDLELATNIHHRLLPASELQIPGISVISKYLPASGLGGDYFDVFELEDKRLLGILIADSQTHGMASALLSSLLKVRLDELKEKGSFAQNLMNHLNRELFAVHQSKLPGLDLVFGVLDRSTLKLEYSSAGAMKPLVWNYPQFAELPGPRNPALGLNPNHIYSIHTVQLRPGDLLFFHTNGLEAVFGKKEESLRGDLARVFRSIKKMDPLDFQTELLAQIDRFQSQQSEIPDDITLIQLLIDKKALYLTQSK